MVLGPPGAGKSFAVIRYLSRRASPRPVAEGAEMSVKRYRSDASDGHVHVTYQSLKTLTEAQRHQPLQFLVRRVLQELYGGREGNVWGKRSDVNLVMFGHLVGHYFQHQPVGSQVHVVLDDVDGADGQVDAVHALLTSCARLPSTSHLFVWVLCRVPIPLVHCSRIHFIPKPMPGELRSWLETGAPPSTTPNDLVAHCVEHYATRKPMSSSVMASDPRWLLQCVSDTLPHVCAVLAAKGKVNDLDLSKAWSLRTASVDATVGASSMDIVLDGIRTLGATAMLLCVAVFYCGAVAPSKDRFVFGEAWDTQRRGNTSAHTDSVLTSTTHIISRKRLLAVYQHLAQMTKQTCVRRGDIAAPPLAAAHHLRGLIEWGLLSATAGRGDLYQSHMPLSTATALSQDLDLRLLDLIPTR